MKPEQYAERKTEIEGWPVNVTSYKLGEMFHCTVDNVSPGAWLARTTGATADEAEKSALEKAKRLLRRTRRLAV